MKIALVLWTALLLSACSTGYDPDVGEYFISGTDELNPNDLPPKNELNILAKKLVAEMLSNNKFVSKQNAIAVTSIVDLNSLSKTNQLGHQISEGVVHYLHSSGYRVVDFKLTGSIKVTPEGDFIHSRDWKQLNGKYPIDYLVSGTLDEFEDGIYLSMRMVGVQTRVVVGSSQAFINTPKLLANANPELANLENQRVELEIKHAQFDSEVESMIDQKVADAVSNKSNQRVIENTSVNNDDANKQRVYTSGGYLVREEPQVGDE